MRLFVRKLTSRHRRKVGLPDERSSRQRTQSLGHDEVSGQDSAHLEQSCSIRARNRARRRPLRPKNRRMRLPPLLHNVLTPSHPVDAFVSAHRLRLHLECRVKQADHHWRVSLARVSLSNVHATHACYSAEAPWLHANPAVCLCVASTALFVSPLFLSFSSNFKCSKSDKTRHMRLKTKLEKISGAARQGRVRLRAPALGAKKGTFSSKKCDLGSW